MQITLIHKFLLRVPAELWNDITQAAAKSGRSRNAEILHRLRDSFENYRV